MTEILIGSDPELFVRKADGTYISGHHFECGTKEQPMKVANGFVQNDGMALEFNVSPSKTKVEFVNNTILVIKDLTAILRAKDAGASLAAIACCDFGEEYIKSVPPKVSELGCNPDFNAWTGDANPMPDPRMPFRTGSGHVHIGWTKEANIDDPEHYALCRAVAKECDYYLGGPSLLWDPDNRRRELYGRAGAFRPKPYGLEYRVLSNAWLKRKETMEFVFERAQTAAIRVLAGKRKTLHEKFGNLAQQVIDSPSVEVRARWTTNHQAWNAAVMKNGSQISA